MYPTLGHFSPFLVYGGFIINDLLMSGLLKILRISEHLVSSSLVGLPFFEVFVNSVSNMWSLEVGNHRRISIET